MTLCLHFNLSSPLSAPSGPPLNFMATPDSTSLRFTWSLPAPSDRNGAITDYTIQCSTGSTTQFSQTVSSPTYTASGLSPYTNYTCSVLASTSVGDGPSARLVVLTLEAGMCH